MKDKKITYVKKGSSNYRLVAELQSLLNMVGDYLIVTGKQGGN